MRGGCGECWGLKQGDKQELADPVHGLSRLFVIISSYSPPPPPRAAGEEDELRYDAVGQAGGGVWDGDANRDEELVCVASTQYQGTNLGLQNTSGRPLNGSPGCCGTQYQGTNFGLQNTSGRPLNGSPGCCSTQHQRWHRDGGARSEPKEKKRKLDKLKDWGEQLLPRVKEIEDWLHGNE